MGFGFNLNDAKNLAKAMFGSKNMEQFLLNQIGTPETREMVQVVSMIKNHDENGLENMARQSCKQQGIDADELYKILKNVRA